MELEHLIRRIKAEFLEMPGLRLTVPQASRLWGLERTLTESVIEMLVGSDFLRRSHAGVIIKNDV